LFVGKKLWKETKYLKKYERLGIKTSTNKRVQIYKACQYKCREGLPKSLATNASN
jgi:hypothetical protein